MRYFAITLIALILAGCGQRGALYFPGETGSYDTPSPPASVEPDSSDREDNDD